MKWCGVTPVLFYLFLHLGIPHTAVGNWGADAMYDLLYTPEVHLFCNIRAEKMHHVTQTSV